MRVLITGGDGFVARWVADAALRRGWPVFLGHHHQAGHAAVRGLPTLDAAEWVPLNMLDSEQIYRAVHRTRPEAIIHLAAISHVPAAEADPVAAYNVNTIGIARLIDVLYRERDAGALATRLLVVGSAEQYGRHQASEMPLTELTSQLPMSVYAATKAAQESTALQGWRRWGIRVILTRSFPSSGPGHDRRFLLPSLVDRVKNLPNSGGTLGVGNLTTTRDYLHVRDVAQAYLALLERGQPGTAYNVSSGIGLTVEEASQRVLRIFNKEATIVSESALQREADLPFLIGSNERLKTDTGWTPQFDFDAIIRDIRDSVAGGEERPRR
jgi:GDP-4-dehydro-6-deoxy-D-mannose reductase